VKRETVMEHASRPAPEDAASRAPTLDEQLEDALVALAPVYRMIAWSRDNDRIALDRRIESVEQQRARAHAEAAAQTERWHAEQAEARRRSAEEARARSAGHDHGQDQRRAVMAPPLPSPRRGRDDPPRARRPSLETLFGGSQGERGPRHDAAMIKPPLPAPPAGVRARPAPEAPPEAEATSAGDAGSMARAHVDPRAAPPEPSAPRAADGSGERATPPAIEKGVKVRVLSGPFAHKLGVVGEIDARGGARVHLGLLSTRLELADLEPVAEARERPALQSSHRRPLAPAPRKVR
jgi:hypothetical protein